GAFGVAAALFHPVAHGVSKALLFLGAGSVMHSLNDETDVWKMGGLRHRMPITAITFVIGAASLAGIVPLSGFFSKDEVLLAVLDNRNPVFIILALAAVVLSALYMARVTFIVFFGKLKTENEHVHESPKIMTVPLMLLAFFAMTVGFLAFNWTDAYRGFGDFLTGEGDFHIEWWLTILSLLLALSGVLIGWLAYSKDIISHDAVARRFSALHRLIVNKYYIDEIYQWVIDHMVMVFSRFVAFFDRVVVNDTLVNGTAWSVMLSALRVRLIQTGRMPNYGLAMALGVLGLALIWWVVQT
ncbi:MAG: NADH-quinone oxidoreductase subunit L, partial [Chloroflexi bacterium]|nr:NADH-quinone oxidoreductase subunit L [Chloroflexota bacterium]